MTSPRKGMTLLEIIIALGVVVVAILGIMSALVAASRTDESTAEQVRALNACRTMIETMKQTTFSEIYRRYNSTPGDDPGGAGTSPGPNFDVPGLRAQPGDGDGMAGQILFPEIGNVLNETFVDARMGMFAPKDLNGDNDAVDANVTNYMILPVRVVVDWRGAAGNTHMELTTYLFP